MVAEPREEQVGDRIKSLRERKGFSQYALAKATGLSHPYIKMLEENSVERPSFRNLQAIAAALEVTFEDLTGLSGATTEDVDLDIALAKRLSRFMPHLRIADPEKFLESIAALPEHDQHMLEDLLKSMRKRARGQQD